MARKRDPARDAARQLWEKSGKTAKLKDIADELGKRPSQVRKWKSEDHWEQAQGKGSAPIQKERSLSSVAPKAILESDVPDKQKRFATLYLQSFNATKAYMQAYGTDYQTANANGPRLLVNASIKKLIDELKAEQAAELHMTQMDVLNDLAKQAKADIGDYVEFGTKSEVVRDGWYKPVKDKLTGEYLRTDVPYVNPKDSSKVDTSLIKSVHQGRDGVVIELYDKQKAMDLLLKNLPDGAALRKQKAEADIAQAKANQANSSESAEKVVFVDSEEAMKKYMKEHPEDYDDVGE